MRAGLSNGSDRKYNLVASRIATRVLLT